jgi:fibronectin type 3 domain-containing protein
MSLSFTAQQGGSNPASQSLTISNTGGGTLTWAASDNASWLTISQASGTGNSVITVRATTGSLTAGTQNGAITVSAPGATTVTVPVNFTITAGAATTSSATLTWNANTESDLAGYKIYRATSSGAYGAPLATISAGTVSYAATGLQSGNTYFFVVTAYDSAGNESAFSNEVSKSIF